MAATPTDIVNIGLLRVGAKRISDLATDANNEGRIARDLYHEARRDLLNLHNWNFAIKRVQLTVSATEPTFGWDYLYPLPADLVRIISVHPHDDDEATVSYRLEYHASHERVLVTNSNQVFLRYVWDLEDVTLMSAAFRDALAWRLARDFALALSKSNAAAEGAEHAFQRKLARAKSIDGVEDYPERMAEGSWITERFPDTSRA